MVSIKEAVENAAAFADATLGAQQATTARLEEVETVTVDGKYAWQITLSFVAVEEWSPIDKPLQQTLAAFRPPKRVYKSFIVLKETGDVLSMKIRELAGA